MPVVDRTNVQKEFERVFGSLDALPPQPSEVSDRNWQMFSDHILRRIGPEALSKMYQAEGTGNNMSKNRAFQILNQTFVWVLRAHEHRTKVQETLASRQ